MAIKKSALTKVSRVKRGKLPIGVEVPAEVLEGLTGGGSGKKDEANKVSNLTTAQRLKRIKDRGRIRLSFDCTQELSDAIAMLMEKYRSKNDSRSPFPKSDLIELVLVLGLQKLLENGEGIRSLYIPTTSPHYAFKLSVPPAPDVSDYDADSD